MMSPQEKHTEGSPGPNPILTRRQLMKGASALGLSAAVLGPLLAACTRVEDTMTATLAPTAPPLPAETPFTTPIPAPTFAPRPSPTATFTPRPTATSTAIPQPTATAMPHPTIAPTATPTPSPTPLPTPPGAEGPKAPVAFNLTERQKIAHLLRRAGFGFNTPDLDRAEGMGLSATINELIDFESVDDSDLDQRIAGAGLDFELPPELRRWWYLRMAYTKRPLQEKMTLFWHGILTSGLKKVGQNELMIAQNTLFKQGAMGSYRTLLENVGRDPAMLVWLDSRSNRKEAPNENYARELMELFTLSPGNYTEEDVREAARAFTGWGLTREGFVFNDHFHDYGNKLFLGKMGNFDGDDVVRIILEQPQAARYITTRLWEFFAYEDPEPEVIDRLSAVFVSNDYVIRDVMQALLTSPEFYSQRAYRTQLKSPIELVVQTSRALNIDSNGKGLAELASHMGHILFDPPDVSGWPGGAAWVNSSSILQRVNLANRISRLPLPPVGRKELTDLFLDGVPDPTVEAALDYFEAETQGSRDLGVSRGLLYLMLAGPGYQRG